MSPFEPEGSQSRRDIQRPPPEWEPDRTFQERCGRMLEVAKRLKCEEAYHVMMAVVAAMQHFEHPEYIYRGPSEKLLRKKEISYGSKEDGAEAAWRENDAIYSQFDLPSTRGGSDWGRAIGTFRAAIVPGEGASGIFDVTAPPQGQKGDEAWQRFEVWCDEHRLNAQGLWRVATALRKEHKMYPSERDAIKEKLDGFTTAKLDQIVMAGYNTIGDVYVSSGSGDIGYKPLEGLMHDLDPKRRDAASKQAHTAAIAARNKYLKPHALPPSTEKGKWSAISSRARYDWDELWKEAMNEYDRALEQTIEKLHPRTPPVEIAESSAAAHHRPTACVTARYSKSGEKNSAHGIHPFSSEFIVLLAGKDALWVSAPYLRFDVETKKVVTINDFHLIGQSGPILERKQEPAKTPEAVAYFAKLLAEHAHDTDPDKRLSFTWQNDLMVETVPQWHARSQGALPTTFTLEEWYRKRFAELGNITSIADAESHIQELMLTPKDMFPRQEEVIARVEREYPSSVTLHGYTYPIFYRYTSKEEEFAATITITIGRKEQEEAFLSLPSSTNVFVGPSEHPLPVQWEIQGFAGYSYEGATTDIVPLQEELDHARLLEEWKKYTHREKEWRVNVEVASALPEAHTITGPIEPYAMKKNGEPAYPVPALSSVGVQEGTTDYAAQYCLFRTQKEAAAAERWPRKEHAENQARAERQSSR